MSIIVPPQDLAPSVASRIVTLRFADLHEGPIAPGRHTVTFTLPGDLRVPADDVIIRAGAIEVKLDANGEGQVRLPTHDPDAIGDGVGSDWYLLVSKSWSQQVDMIRVPPGTGAISLADITPVVEVTPAMGQWLLTGAGVELVEGSAWGATVAVAGGVARFKFTVPSAAILAGAAVDAELASRDIVEGGDVRVGTVIAKPEILHALVDRNGFRTWLESRDRDGHPTDRAEQILRAMFGVHASLSSPYLYALADANGMLTDLTVDADTGQFAEFVIERLRARLDGATTGGAMVMDLPYDPVATLLQPLRVDETQAAIWGSSTAAQLQAHLDPALAARGISLWRGGQGSELIEHHAARMGALPARLTFPGDVIPASGSVDVTSSNVPPLAELLPFEGTVAGVAGTLASTATSLVFTRSTAGEATACPPQSEFTSYQGTLHRNALVLLQTGKNNLTSGSAAINDPAQVIGKTLTMARYQAALSKRVLIIGQFVNTGTAAGAPERARIEQVNDALRDAVGPAFFDTTAWITSASFFADCGITSPTSEDLAEQALGNLPPSASANAAHFNDAAIAAYVTKLEQHLTTLGWI